MMGPQEIEFNAGDLSPDDHGRPVRVRDITSE